MKLFNSFIVMVFSSAFQTNAWSSGLDSIFLPKNAVGPGSDSIAKGGSFEVQKIEPCKEIDRFNGGDFSIWVKKTHAYKSIRFPLTNLEAEEKISANLFTQSEPEKSILISSSDNRFNYSVGVNDRGCLDYYTKIIIDKGNESRESGALGIILYSFAKKIGNEYFCIERLGRLNIKRNPLGVSASKSKIVDWTYDTGGPRVELTLRDGNSNHFELLRVGIEQKR